MDNLTRRHEIGDPVEPKTSPVQPPPGQPVPPPTPTIPSRRQAPTRAGRYFAALAVLCWCGTAGAQQVITEPNPGALPIMQHEVHQLTALTDQPLPALQRGQQPRKWLPYSDSLAHLLLLDMGQRDRYKELDAGYNAEIDQTEVDVVQSKEILERWEEQVRSMLHADQLAKWEELHGRVNTNSDK